jgi:Synergist-CTERM protein sorting domain-containing protein
MGHRALVASLLLFPSLALAQTQGLATVSPSEIGRADCPATTTDVTVTFLPLVTGTFTAGQDKYRFFASTSACSSTVPSSGSIAGDRFANETTVQTLKVSPDALRSALAIAVTCDSADDVAYYVCVYLVNTIGGIVGTASSGNTQSFQLAVPPAPVITNVAPANSALDVTVTKGTTTAAEKADTNITFQVVASATGQTTVTTGQQNGPSIRVGGLANNVEYTVVAYAYSSADNQSAVSTAATGTPLPFESFWEQYQGANGQEQGGCGGGAGALSLLALLPLALRRRRP